MGIRQAGAPPVRGAVGAGYTEPVQPVPHPDTWFSTWLDEQKLLNAGVLQAYLRKRDEAALQDPSCDEDPPTLGALLERDGLLTAEQREAGEREAARRCAEFMSWRSQALRDQDRRPPPG